MRSFKIAAFILAILCTEGIFAQPWLWGTGTTGYGMQLGNAVTTDNSGNVFIAGAFDTTITFGSTTLTNPGGGGAFIAKYDASGNFIWARGGTGTDYCYATSVACDVSGNIYLVGAFGNPSITFGSITLLNSGPTDIFIVKYDPSGNVIWAKAVGGTFADDANSVTTDNSGNVYLTGNIYSSSVAFGSTTLIGPGVYVAKCDSSGNFLWAKSTSGSFNGQSLSVTTNSSAVYITGYFTTDNATFGSITLTNAGGVGMGTEDIFLTKYDTLGNFGWAKSAGGTGDDRAFSCSADGSSIYVTGEFDSSPANFGSLNITTNGTDDAFIAKYDLTGGAIWAKKAGGPFSDYAYSCHVDPSGTYMVGGFHSTAISFDAITLNQPSPGYTPLFVVKYASDGSVICADLLENGGDRCAVTSSGFGNTYIVGTFGMDSLVVGTDTLMGPGYGNIYLAKYYCNSGNGIVDKQELGGIFIFPNPSNGKFKLDIKEGSTQYIFNVSVSDVLGNIIQTSKINSSQDFDLSNQSKGLYIVKIQNENGVSVNKIIIE